jgi:hypothetical protein
MGIDRPGDGHFALFYGHHGMQPHVIPEFRESFDDESAQFLRGGQGRCGRRGLFGV